mmetsp:Transcript_9384/g.20458  ORF Transcript_9384/g.20458 Transcript_9384/m.20458 type:complete len:241 (+) Transcript_9384:337-1059(+)
MKSSSALAFIATQLNGSGAPCRMMSVQCVGRSARRALSACSVPTWHMHTGTPAAAMAAAAAIFASMPPVTSCEAVDALNNRSDPKPASLPVRVTRISGRRDAPGSLGGLLYTPRTSVRKTAIRGRKPRHSASDSVSPLRMAEPCCSSKTASPCSTGTSPSRTHLRTSATSARIPMVRSQGHLARVRTPGKAGRPTAAIPFSRRAATTILFRRHTDERVSAKPRQSKAGWTLPRCTEYALA